MARRIKGLGVAGGVAMGIAQGLRDRRLEERANFERDRQYGLQQQQGRRADEQLGMTREQNQQTLRSNNIKLQQESFGMAAKFALGGMMDQAKETLKFAGVSDLQWDNPANPQLLTLYGKPGPDGQPKTSTIPIGAVKRFAGLPVEELTKKDIAQMRVDLYKGFSKSGSYDYDPKDLDRLVDSAMNAILGVEQPGGTPASVTPQPEPELEGQGLIDRTLAATGGLAQAAGSAIAKSPAGRDISRGAQFVSQGLRAGADKPINAPTSWMGSGGDEMFDYGGSPTPPPDQRQGLSPSPVDRPAQDMGLTPNLKELGVDAQTYSDLYTRTADIIKRTGKDPVEAAKQATLEHEGKGHGGIIPGQNSTDYAFNFTDKPLPMRMGVTDAADFSATPLRAGKPQPPQLGVEPYTQKPTAFQWGGIFFKQRPTPHAQTWIAERAGEISDQTPGAYLKPEVALFMAAKEWAKANRIDLVYPAEEQPNVDLQE